MSFELPKREGKWSGEWLENCVKAIADKISDLDDDVDALWAASVGDVMSPAEFAPGVDGKRFFYAAQSVAPEIIHTFPEGEKATGSNAFHINGKDRVFFSTNLNIYELIDSKLHKVLLANA